MAHKDSKVLALSEKYKLGKYEFSLETREIPQTNLMDVIAKATGPNGKLGAKTIQVSKASVIEGWYVDANSETADVYVKFGESAQISVHSTRGAEATVTGNSIHMDLYCESGHADHAMFLIGDTSEKTVTFSCSGSVFSHFDPSYGGTGIGYGISNGWSWSGPKIYSAGTYTATGTGYLSFSFAYVSDWLPLTFDIFDIKVSGIETGDTLIGRFAIDNRIAGATAGNGGALPGPDGQPWQDVDDGQPTLWPGDEGYPDPEDPDYPGDDEPYYPPSKTLYLEVDGALSGRHNDPLNDTSYSYVPTDKATVKPYGYGGDGGHGGGGGGGASTVIVYKFATDKADSKEITVKPKRHGYGSGGGKGGKGGDGCILIYY